MNKKTISKMLISVLLITLIVTILLSVDSYAAFSYSMYNGTVIGGEATSKPITQITSTVLTAIRVLGSGISMIMLTVIFIKYMLSSAGDKAELKKNLIPFTIGAVILFAASNIVGLMQKVAENMFAES